MNANVIAEKLLGRFDVSALISVKEGIAHPDNDYMPFGVAVVDEPEQKKTTRTETDSPGTQPSVPKLKPLFRKPLRLFLRRKQTATPSDDAHRE
jgi:hypothetical protein